MQKILKISKKSRTFRIFCFPYKAHDSATFQPTCQKWRSGSSSGLPVSESAQFQRQIRIFNAVFEKKNRKVTLKKLEVKFLDDFFFLGKSELVKLFRKIYKSYSKFPLFLFYISGLFQVYVCFLTSPYL